MCADSLQMRPAAKTTQSGSWLQWPNQLFVSWRLNRRGLRNSTRDFQKVHFEHLEIDSSLEAIFETIVSKRIKTSRGD